MTPTEGSRQEFDSSVRTVRQRKDDEAFRLLILFLLRGFAGDEKSRQDISENLKPEDITEDRVTAHPFFRLSHPEFQKTAEDRQTQFNQSASATQPARQSIYEDPRYLDTAMRTAVSIGIEKYTDDCMKRGVKYGFGTKDGKNTIDCSGFVAQAVRSILETTGMADRGIMRIFSNHSDGQIQSLMAQTGHKLEGKDVNMSTLKAGMVMAIDSGKKKWDGGRVDGIDHTGIIFADKETGKLMFAESRGGVGVMTTPLDQYLKDAEKKGWKLFAADVVKLASDEYKKDLQLALADPAKPLAGKIPGVLATV